MLSKFDINVFLLYNYVMDEFLLQRLLAITPEENKILTDGGVDIGDYTRRKSKRISGMRYFEDDKLIYPRRHPRFYPFPEHGHDYCEIMLAVSGKITHDIHGEKITLYGGDLIILNKSARHSIEKTDLNDIGLNYLLSDNLLLDFADKTTVEPLAVFFRNCFKQNNDGGYLLLSGKDDIIARNLIENLVYMTVFDEKNKYGELPLTLFLLLERLVTLNREKLVNDGVFAIESKENRERTYKQKITRYIGEHYADGTLSSCAATLGINPQYLSRLTAKLFGESFKKIATKKRITEAEKLLASSNLTVQEISAAVGYENVYGFNQAFIKIHGLTPARWRDLNCKNP